MTSNTWTQKTAAPAALSRVNLGGMGSLLLVPGGSVSGATVPTNVVRQWDSATDIWSTKANLPAGRYDSGVAVIGTKLYVIAGGDNTGQKTNVYEWTQSTNTWATKASIPNQPGFAVTYAPVAVIGTKIYVASPFANRLQEYDQATDSWATKANPPANIGKLAAVGTKLYGITRVGNLLRVWDQATDAWSSRTSPPAGTASNMLLAVGSRLLWINVNTTSYQYETTTDTWTPLSFTGTPTGVGGSAVDAVVGSNKVALLDSVTTGTSPLWQLDTNRPPNKPTITSPNGIEIDRTVDLPIVFTYDDPDGDSQSSHSIRYRPADTVDWTATLSGGAATSHTIAGGTLAADDWEVQALVGDSWGENSLWSDSAFFTAGSPPAAPTYTAPASGATVLASYEVDFTAVGMTAYQLRTVADNAGVPDESTVYTDTGIKLASGDSAAVTVASTNNGGPEWIQIRRRNSPTGLWSTWASRKVNVNYLPAHDPTITLVADPDNGAIIVQIDNPAPAGGEPAIDHNDVYVNDDDGRGWKRKAAGVAPDTNWTYWDPRSELGVDDYDDLVVVIAYGVNGVPSGPVPS